MNIFLILAFLFFIGSLFGWVLELFFRRAVSGKWINPGFLTGPYVPLYGFGLCILYLIAEFDGLVHILNPVLNKIVLFIMMTFFLTLIEYIAGVLLLKLMNVRLWDYSNEWGNIKGLVCPLFSFFWALLGGVYYFLVHPHILNALNWLSENLVFSFVIGMFYGIFIIDFVHSANLLVKIKKFAGEKQIIVRYEQLKQDIRAAHESYSSKYSFFRFFRSERPFIENLKNYYTHMKEQDMLEKVFGKKR